MIKLFLDDCRKCPKGYNQVFTAEQAIIFLKAFDVSHISLDHDLGPIEAGTGYDVACYIETEHAIHGKFANLKWRIHSSNPVGRQRMAAALRKLESYTED